MKPTFRNATNDKMNRPKKEITIYDIAKELDLSASTVCRALRGNPVIKKETQEKVVRCAQRLMYQKNSFASYLREKKSYRIGVVVPKLDSHFMSSCLAGMEEVANKEGYTLIISQSQDSVEREIENAQTMFNSQVDGLIVSQAANARNASHYIPYEDRGIPIVFFDRVPPLSKYISFGIDNKYAGYIVGKHLIEQGCKNLLHVTMRSQCPLYLERAEGFESAAAESNIPCEIAKIKDLNLKSGREFAFKLLKSGQLPDGIFIANDAAAIGCLLELKSNGISIPKDVAIVGFNNDPITTIVEPNLTTIDYPGKEAGIVAARTLINSLKGNNDEMKFTNRVVLNSNMLIRQSSLKKNK